MSALPISLATTRTGGAAGRALTQRSPPPARTGEGGGHLAAAGEARARPPLPPWAGAARRPAAVARGGRAVEVGRGDTPPAGERQSHFPCDAFVAPLGPSVLPRSVTPGWSA